MAGASDLIPSFASEEECVSFMRGFVAYAKAGDIDPVKFSNDMEVVTDVLRMIEPNYFTLDDWRVLFPYMYHTHNDVTETVSLAFSSFFPQFDIEFLKEFVDNCLEKCIDHPNRFPVSVSLTALTFLVKKPEIYFVIHYLKKFYDKIIDFYFNSTSIFIETDCFELLRFMFRWAPEYIDTFRTMVLDFPLDKDGITKLVKVLEFVSKVLDRQFDLFVKYGHFRELPFKVIEKVMTSDDILGKHVVVQFLSTQMIGPLTRTKMETLYPNARVHILLKDSLQQFSDDKILYKEILFLLCGAVRNGGLEYANKLDIFRLLFDAYDREIIRSYTELVGFLIHCMINWTVLEYVFQPENVQLYNNIAQMVFDTLTLVHFEQQQEFIIHLMSFFRVMEFAGEFEEKESLIDNYQLKFFCDVIKPIFYHFLDVVLCKAGKHYQCYGLRMVEILLFHSWSIEHVISHEAFMRIFVEGDIVIDPYNESLLTDVLCYILHRREYAAVFNADQIQFLRGIASEGHKITATVAEPQTIG